MAPVDLCAAALDLARGGWHVHPVRHDKTPLLAHWKAGATTDPEQVRAYWHRWPGAGVGVHCGPSGLLVVDIDGPTGRASWIEWLAERYPDDHAPARTLTSRTPSGGLHLWYEVAAALPPTVRALGPGIDTRSGDSYAVAPPSPGKRTGTRYRWRPESGPVHAAPGPLVDALTPTTRPVSPEPVPATFTATTTYGRTALRRATDAVRTAPEGTRNATLNGETYGLAGLVLGGHLAPDEVRAAMTDAGLAAGLTPHEVDRTVRSALRRLG
jgi:hypothetical protein